MSILETMKVGSNRFVAVLWCLALIGCTEKPSTHPVFKYYPPTSVFEEGYVNKYYEHYYPTNTNTTASTRISYSLLKKTSDTEFIVESYNAGFWLKSKRYFHIQKQAIYLDSSVSIWRRDTVVHEVEKGLMSQWDAAEMDDFHYHINRTFTGGAFSFRGKQTGLKDSIINGASAKVFKNSYRQFIYREDTTENTWVEETYYLEGLGMYGSKEVREDYTWEVELVEQMPLSKFQELADHGEKRVAYIDPSETLDQEANFEICGHEKFIADYYNSTPDGDYLYGKAALVDTVLTNLDPEKMLNQTGMLTFRFVVNCEGKAGRFIAKGYDLNYQPYEFPEETVNHLYELLLLLKDWRVVVINDEPRDAYFYFTFKLNNGEITDILP